MSTYHELLRDPRWQRKRLEAMNRAGFKCEECGSAETTLNVHHLIYRKGAKPWEYEPDELVCLCEDCHGTRHVQADGLRRLLDKLDAGERSEVLLFACDLVIRKRARQGGV